MRALALSILLAGSATFTIASPQDSDKTEALSRFVAEGLQRTHTPGVLVAVAYNGTVVFARAKGSASVESGLPLTHDTVFRVGAPSALFTSVAALSLASEGKLDLDAPIGRYVPSVNPAFSRMTTRQLLDHRAGLKSDHMARPLYDAKDLKDEISSWKPDRVLTQPGRIYSQSNPGVSIAGLVLESIERKPFADVAAARVLVPLGMKSASFHFSDAVTHPLTQGHSIQGDRVTVVRPFAEGSLGWPSGSLFASVDDLSRFVLALANEGSVPGEKGLSKAIVQSLLAPGQKDSLGTENQFSMTGSRFRGVYQWAIAGGWAGLTNAVRVVPERGFAEIVITNASNSLTEEIAERAMELYLPLEPRIHPPATKLEPVPDAERQRMSGTFENETRIEIHAGDGKLTLTSDGVTSEIQKSGNQQYVAHIPALRGPARATRFSVVPGADGQVEFLVMGSRAWVRVK
jgi:CubicO group peptidase (beta-lactamase class C family)